MAAKSREAGRMSTTRWHTHCPVCGKSEKVTHQEESIHYCEDCKFQWSTELGEDMLLLLAVAHQQERRPDV